MSAAKPDQILEETCPQCGKNLVVKQGRYGEFTACTGYPECKYVKQKLTGAKCPKDGGDIAERAAITGALSLYLNFINLFTLLLQLLGQRD